LSFAALGLLVYLLDQRLDWEVRTDHLYRKFGCSEYKILELIKELRHAGFVHGSRLKDGTFRYLVFDQPTAKPHLENRGQGPGRRLRPTSRVSKLKCTS
jgi:hypothetical protein